MARRPRIRTIPSQTRTEKDVGCCKKRGLELEKAAECREGAYRGVVGCGILGGTERYSERRGRVSLGEVGGMGA